MPTFLELVQRTASDSGTVPDAYQIATVAFPTGRKAKIVSLVQRAWISIQTSRPGWLWMRGQFASDLTQGVREYVGALPRFSRFIATRDSSERRFSLYDASTGRDPEGQILFTPFDDFYVLYLRGSRESLTGKPQRFTIGHDGALIVHPIPDKAYTVRGQYMRDEQTLENDADVPEMPARFHDLIVYEALLMLAASDESFSSLPIWATERRRLTEQLTLDQLPPMRTAEAMV
jgi:hypothetical protein